MKELDTLLGELGNSARKEATPEVDVRQRVLQSLAVQRTIPRFDFVPLAFGSLAVTAAAVLVVTCLPSWQTLFDPWASYFVQ